MCSWGVGLESTGHYLFRYQNYTTERSKLIKGTYNFIPSLPRNILKKKLENIILYGSEDFK